MYTAGAFDVFHPGHLSFLKEARKLGRYLSIHCCINVLAIRVSIFCEADT